MKVKTILTKSVCRGGDIPFNSLGKYLGQHSILPWKSWIVLLLLAALCPFTDALAQSFIVQTPDFPSSTGNPGIAGHGYPLTITRDSGTGTDTSYSGTKTLNFSTTEQAPLLCPWACSNLQVNTLSSCSSANGSVNVLFSGGQTNLCLVMTDVGAYSFSVADGTVSGASNEVISRPSYLSVSPVSIKGRGELPDTICGPSDSTFTYMQEPMLLTFNVTAMSELNQATPSYGPKLNNAINTVNNWKIFQANSSMGLVMAGVDATRVIVSSPSRTWNSGTGTVSVKVTFNRRTDGIADGPYSNVAIGVAPIDEDGVQLKDKNLDADNNGVNERASLGMNTLRYGRLKIANAYGSDVLPLPVDVQAQYWNGTTFVTSADDHCTPLTAGYFQLNPVPNLPQPNTSLVDGTLGSNGKGRIALTRPATPLLTKAVVAIRTRADNATDAGGNPAPPPTTPGLNTYLPGLGTGTFGVYKSGPVIYRRELHY